MKIDTGIKLGVGGSTNVKVVNSKTGKVKYEHRDRPNRLVNGYFARALNNASGAPLRWGIQNHSTQHQHWLTSGGAINNIHCVIGTHNAPAEAADTIEVFHNVAKAEANNSLSTRSEYGDNPVWITRTYIFVAGTFVGNMRELGLINNDASLPNSELYARQVLDAPVPVTADDEVHVEWRFEVDFGSRVWEGVIPFGQRPGASGDTDIAWRLTINKDQMMTHCQRTSDGRIGAAAGSSIGYGPYHSSFGQAGNQIQGSYLRMGNSNAESDLENDGLWDIKGDQLFGGTGTNISLCNAIGYNASTRTISYRKGLEHSDTPDYGEIGEMIIGTDTSQSTHQSRGTLCRVTFTPKLQLAPLHRLFLAYSVSLADKNNP